MINREPCSLRYKGNVQFDAPQIVIWRHLTDPVTSAAITPGIIDWQIIKPGHLFQIQVGIETAGRKIGIPVRVEWSDLVPPKSMVLKAKMEWQRCLFDIIGNFNLSENERGGVLEFTAEAILSNPALRPLAHPIAQRTLKQFLINLKKTVAKSQPTLTR